MDKFVFDQYGHQVYDFLVKNKLQKKKILAPVKFKEFGLLVTSFDEVDTNTNYDINIVNKRDIEKTNLNTIASVIIGKKLLYANEVFVVFGNFLLNKIVKKDHFKALLEKYKMYKKKSNINSCIGKSSIKNAIDDFNRIHMTNYSDAPYTFTSTICREQHFRMPLYKYWCNLFKENPRLHRKQWEFVYICQSLYERGYLKKGISGVGFGVGREPLASLFSSFGVEVLASDLEYNSAEKLGWVNTDQHSNYLSDLNERGLCDEDNFKRLVSFRNIDMNQIPKDINGYDFCWSSCSLEHLGSIAKGIEFIINSLKTLKPGGFAIHTTEFNLSSNENTIDNNDSYVIFRQKDIDALTELLYQNGHRIEPVDFCSGNDAIERYIDLPPYLEEPHLRLNLNRYTATSIGLLIHKKN